MDVAGHRAKLYRLDDQNGNNWTDCGIGIVSITAGKTQAKTSIFTIQVVAEVSDSSSSKNKSKAVEKEIANGKNKQQQQQRLDPTKLLLEHVIERDINYSKNTNTIILWTDPITKKDMAISFQEVDGCNIAWEKIQNAIDVLEQENKSLMQDDANDGSNGESSSSKSKSSQVNNNDENTQQNNKQSKGHRAKLYHLNEGDGNWVDHGIGFVFCGFINSLNCNGIRIISENAISTEKQENGLSSTFKESDILLEAPILQDIEYSRNGDTILTWTEHPSNTDLAISFEEASGCNEVWDKVNDYQSKGSNIFIEHDADFDANAHNGGVDGRLSDFHGYAGIDGLDHYSGAYVSNSPSLNDQSELPPVTVDNLPSILHFIANTPQYMKQRHIDMLLDTNTEIKSAPSASSSPIDETNDKKRKREESEELDLDANNDAVNNKKSDETPQAVKSAKLDSTSDEKENSLLSEEERAGLSTSLNQSSETKPERNSKNYFEQLLNMFTTLEEANDKNGLRILFEIVKAIALLDDTRLFEEMIGENNFQLMTGIFEYDPEISQANHRNLIRNIVYKEVVPILDNNILAIIHKRFRLSFLRDVLLPRILDESSFKKLSGMDDDYAISIVQSLQQDSQFMKNLFSLLKDQSLPHHKRELACAFLAELSSLVQKMQPHSRHSFYRYVADCEENYFKVMEDILGDEKSSSKERLDIGEILINSLHHDPHLFRNYILELERVIAKEDNNKGVGNSGATAVLSQYSQVSQQQGEASNSATPVAENSNATNVSELDNVDKSTSSKSEDVSVPRSNILSQVIKRLVSDPESGVQNQGAEILRMLLDPETMDQEKDEFLSIFYDHYLSVLIEPLDKISDSKDDSQNQLDRSSSSSSDVKQKNIFNLSLAAAPLPILNISEYLSSSPSPVQNLHETSRIAVHLTCDLLCFFIQTHSYRIKYFVARHNLVNKVMKLLKNRDKYLVLDSIRFIRTCIGTKEDFYSQYFIKNDVLGEVFAVFKSNGGKNNLISSAVIEMVEFIRNESIQPLAKHIVQEHGEYFQDGDKTTAIDPIKSLIQSNSASGNNGTPSSKSEAVLGSSPKLSIGGTQQHGHIFGKSNSSLLDVI